MPTAPAPVDPLPVVLRVAPAAQPVAKIVAVHTRQLRTLAWLLSLLVAAGAMVFGYLFFREWSEVTKPIAEKLRSDQRNSGFQMVGRTASVFDAANLVLDLEDVGGASPTDLFRGFMQAAEAMHEQHKTFDSVTLCRAKKPVYRIHGKAFDEIGSAYASGENPVYLLRTLPEKLVRPDGTRAFESWDGGLLGVFTQQMSDLTSAGRAWESGN